MIGETSFWVSVPQNNGFREEAARVERHTNGTFLTLEKNIELALPPTPPPPKVDAYIASDIMGTLVYETQCTITSYNLFSLEQSTYFSSNFFPTRLL